ncbi:enhanced intracellular survival protein Eis [Mycobacterium sp. M1]|uniref:Enhanced intracellular survival protein Eis n=1 Tax=Mycolicibacter acidiphilus TaxID=2835306 RepID=A0ABS5RH90_9MYCO|nr:enhanced intracellular survival protein Eis [Mycolicibacter acidiphilus]MBS9533367.1 enhanced intracellular survival protein Eis [Mycolicibacter acidiphilus]
MTSTIVRTAVDADWAQIALLDATGFGVLIDPGRVTALRTMVPADGAVVACDRDLGVIGVALYLDLRLTVPGGQVLPAAGISGVVVAPTHRRRGVLRAMYDELHRRIADSGYPIAALTASEGGIYGRFGYGTATIKCELEIDRRFARLHPDAPDPGGVRLANPADCRAELAAVYDRWRLRTPGGLARPTALWDDLLADREPERDGGTPWFVLLHPDGYVLYRVHAGDTKTVRIGEFRAVTADAHAALWRALLGLDLMTTIGLDSHPDDPLPYLLTDTRLVRTTGRRDDLWLRLMDVPAALEARRYAADANAVIAVRDGFRSDGGRFMLDVRSGVAKCTPTSAPAEVEMDLDVLGALYFGAHRASALAAANRLRGEPELLGRLDAAFATPTPAQLGFFF